MATPNFNQLSEDYNRIERAIEYIQENANRQPNLKEVAESVNLSEYHFQRLFLAGQGSAQNVFYNFSPRRTPKPCFDNPAFLMPLIPQGFPAQVGCMTFLYNVMRLLRENTSSAGLGCVLCMDFTPPHMENVSLHPPIAESVSWRLSRMKAGVLHDVMKAEWRNAEWIEDSIRTKRHVQAIFSPERKSAIKLRVRGTNFQIKVWEALLRIPPGQVTSYEKLAELIGSPSAPRAIGNALAHNPIAFLIPCHRVLRKVGDFGNYRYGQARKKAMLMREIG
jgi:AraC family transcriptional regulator of adaptative response/methylated-DNA-[protein]-cysteine methyltransferase